MFANRPRSIAIAILLASALANYASAIAQIKSAPDAQLCVDVVKLKSGKTMRGAILHIDDDGSLTMAVAREWLQKSSPDTFKKLAQDEAVVQRQAWEQLRDRLKKALEAPSLDPRLSLRLKTDLERTEEPLAHPDKADPPQFIWLDISKKTIDKVSRRTGERERIAIWAWSERLDDVEIRAADDLARELEQQKIDASQPPPDLSERFPPRLQDDREWSARLALLTYCVGEPLDFQGTGDMLVEVKGSRGEQDFAPVLAGLLTQQVNSLVKDLLGEGRAAAKPARAIGLSPPFARPNKRKRGLFARPRVDLNPTGRRAMVDSAFVVQLDNGEWETIWSHRETQDASKDRSDAVARIKNDPQVKAALDTVKNLGVANEGQFEEAIRFGAATMAAQQSVDDRFTAFRESMLKRLDGPPLWWEKHEARMTKEARSPK